MCSRCSIVGVYHYGSFGTLCKNLFLSSVLNYFFFRLVYYFFSIYFFISFNFFSFFFFSFFIYLFILFFYSQIWQQWATIQIYISSFGMVFSTIGKTSKCALILVHKQFFYFTIGLSINRES